MREQRASVPVSGRREDVERALQAPLQSWAPGEVVMHSPLHVRTTLRILGVPAEVDLLADGADVYPMPDRRWLRVLPRRRCLPDVEGALLITDAPDGSGCCMAFQWWIRRPGPLPGPCARVVGRLLACAVLRPAAVALSHMAESCG